MSIHGWLLWNQLSGVDGRMGKQHVWEDMLGILQAVRGGRVELQE